MFARKNLFPAGAQIAFAILAAFLLGGCATSKQTTPPRSATEQLLLSTAADRSLHFANLSSFANQKVFLDTSYFDSYDSKYAIGAIRDALSRAGALLMVSPTNSDIIIEARSGALSIDSSDSLLGIPKLGAPVPLAGTVDIPEIALYKAEKGRSVAKIALLAYARQSREHVYSSGSLVGKSYSKYYKILGFFSWTRTDIPEKQTSEKDRQKYESWREQETPFLLPVTNSISTNAPPVKFPATNSPSLKTNLISGK
jgi:Family of unknown function (DUF6655)